jgi:hypothetical protein
MHYIPAALTLLGMANGIASSPAPARMGALVEFQVPFVPPPAATTAGQRLVYEIHLTNFDSRPLELSRVEILSAKGGPPVASYSGEMLAGKMVHVGRPVEAGQKRVVAPGQRVVVYIDLVRGGHQSFVGELRHRLVFRPEREGDAELVVEGAAINIPAGAPLVLGPPVRGSGWVAFNGPSETSVHRRSLLPVNGRARNAQRFAIDWIQLGPDGKPTKGDPARNDNWHGYGAEVLAVADATVAAVKDGIPQNTPLTPERAVPITLDTIGGNHVLLNLGGGRYGFYAHLQPGSLRVKPGDRVRRGQVLGLLGNSGNSDAPHLHFHVGNAPSPLDAEGIPYVLDRFDRLGTVESLDQVMTDGWRPAAAAEARREQIPLDKEVVAFR